MHGLHAPSDRIFDIYIVSVPWIDRDSLEDEFNIPRREQHVKEKG